ncbi:MAG: hypothetical protein ACAH11_06155, partial [Sphingomonas sp.]
MSVTLTEVPGPRLSPPCSVWAAAAAAWAIVSPRRIALAQWGGELAGGPDPAAMPAVDGEGAASGGAGAGSAGARGSGTPPLSRSTEPDPAGGFGTPPLSRPAVARDPASGAGVAPAGLPPEGLAGVPAERRSGDAGL